MERNELLSTIHTLKTVKENLDSEVSRILKILYDSKNYSIDDRWSMYTNLVTSGLITGFEKYGDGGIDNLEYKDTDDPEEANEYPSLDDFGYDRYRSISYLSMYDDIIGIERFTEESIDEWRDAVIRSGDKGFVYDW